MGSWLLCYLVVEFLFPGSPLDFPLEVTSELPARFFFLLHNMFVCLCLCIFTQRSATQAT